MSIPDTIFEVHDDDHTSYRLRPNPEAPMGEGYKYGAVLEWRDHGEGQWKGYFFIGPDALDGLAQAISYAALDVEDDA